VLLGAIKKAGQLLLLAGLCQFEVVVLKPVLAGFFNRAYGSCL
jgi:hypothetical protein